VATTPPRPEAVAARCKNRSWRTTSPNGLARRMVIQMVVSKTSTTTGRRRLRRRYPEANHVCVVRRMGVQKCTRAGRGAHSANGRALASVGNWRRLATAVIPIQVVGRDGHVGDAAHRASCTLTAFISSGSRVSSTAMPSGGAVLQVVCNNVRISPQVCYRFFTSAARVYRISRVWLNRTFRTGFSDKEK
jgi:hypothetical protein